MNNFWGLDREYFEDDDDPTDQPTSRQVKTAEEWRQFDFEQQNAAIRLFHRGVTRVKDLIIDSLSPENAHKLGYMNVWAAPLWWGLLLDGLIALGVPEMLPQMLTIIDFTWDTNNWATPTFLKNIRRRIKRAIRQALIGVNYVGMIEFAVFRNCYHKDGNQISPHVQLVVWGQIEPDHLAAINQAFAGGMDGTTGTDFQPVTDFVGAVAYAVKPPFCGYSRFKKRNGKPETRIWQLPPLTRYRLFEMFGKLKHPDLTLAGGEGLGVVTHALKAIQNLTVTNSLKANDADADDADMGPRYDGAGDDEGEVDDTPISLVGQLVNLIETGTDPDRIFVATTTRQGACDLAVYVEAKTGKTLSWVGTYGDLAERMLREEYDLAGLFPDFETISADQAKALMLKAANQRLGPVAPRYRSEIIRGVAGFKRRGMTPKMALAGAVQLHRKGAFRRQAGKLDPLYLASIYGGYQQLLRDGNRADQFDPLLWLLRGMCDKVHHDKRGSMFDAVVSDGYSETTRGQQLLVDLIAGDRQIISSPVAEW